MFTRSVGLALLFVALVCATVPASADSTARIVRLSYLDGDVQIDRGTGHGAERAVLNMPVVQGTQLSTRGGATAEVEFEDGSTLRLVPDSAVEFRRLSLRSSGERVSSIELAQGTAYLEATTKKDAFSITAGGPEITLTRDAHLRVSRSSSDMELAVFKGEVEVQNPSGSVRVKKNETLNLDLNDPSQYKLAKGIDVESYDAWNQQRDNYQQTYASIHHDGYNSLYNYGWSDLNYYGTFNQFGNYGMLWRPVGVGPGWDPFADGAWMYYPGYGYMFVSAYPWGWMPYRYGSWMYVPGFGWGWRPGALWNTWYAAPVIYNAPAGYVAPMPPAVTNTGRGTVPGTVVVGAGPITDVRNPRFRQWMLEANGVNAPMRKPGVTPVPAPSTTSGVAGNQKTFSTTTRTTTATPAMPTTRTQPRGGVRQSSPPPRPAAPPPAAPPAAAPPTSAPRTSTPPNAREIERSGRWSEGAETSAPRVEPHK